MKRISLHLIVFACLFACASVSLAAPPYDVTVDLTAPSDGGPVDSYELYVDDASVGTLTPGINEFPDLITADGTYVFEAVAINAAAETRSDPVTVTLSALDPPGKPTITIQVDCSPCVLQIDP